MSEWLWLLPLAFAAPVFLAAVLVWATRPAMPAPLPTMRVVK